MGEMALLHCAIFRAFSLNAISTNVLTLRNKLFTGVTLINVSRKLCRFDDHMMLKEPFHWLVPRAVSTQVAGQITAECLNFRCNYCENLILLSATVSATGFATFIAVARYAREIAQCKSALTLQCNFVIFIGRVG